jgi:hypothetical protein
MSRNYKKLQEKITFDALMRAVGSEFANISDHRRACQDVGVCSYGEMRPPPKVAQHFAIMSENLPLLAGLLVLVSHPIPARALLF